MYSFFFFNDTATTEIYTLSLHDALPIYGVNGRTWGCRSKLAKSSALPSRCREAQAFRSRDRNRFFAGGKKPVSVSGSKDRKSTRLNSSHLGISYAVFCLKKKKHRKTRCR